jgi:hypothetical protein
MIAGSFDTGCVILSTSGNESPLGQSEYRFKKNPQSAWPPASHCRTWHKATQVTSALRSRRPRSRRSQHIGDGWICGILHRWYNRRQDCTHGKVSRWLGIASIGWELNYSSFLICVADRAIKSLSKFFGNIWISRVPDSWCGSRIGPATGDDLTKARRSRRRLGLIGLRYGSGTHCTGA